jgi:hypothetical protein
MIALLLLATTARAAAPNQPKWDLVDRGLTIATVNPNYGGFCRLGDAEVEQHHPTLVVASGEAISLNQRLLGGSYSRFAHDLAAEPVLLVETLDGEALQTRLPALVESTASTGGLQVVHLGTVWSSDDVWLSAPGAFLTALSSCSLSEVKPAVLVSAISGLRREQRRTAVAVLNAWLTLDDLSRHPAGALIGVSGLPSNAGEFACVNHGRCESYVEIWLQRTSE